MDVRKIGEHEYEVLDNKNGTYMVVMPRRYCHFYKPEYVFLFKPSKNPKAKTKVVLKKTSYPLSSRIELMCDRFDMIYANVRAVYNRHKYSFEEIVSMYKNKGHQARLRKIHS